MNGSKSLLRDKQKKEREGLCYSFASMFFSRNSMRTSKLVALYLPEKLGKGYRTGAFGNTEIGRQKKGRFAHIR